MRRSLWFPVAALLSLAAASGMELEVAPVRDNAVYSGNEPVEFKILATEDGEPVAGRRVNYRFKVNNQPDETGEFVSKMTPEVVAVNAARPGFVLLRAECAEGGAKVALAGAAVAPEQIRASVRLPADFDAFWAKARAEVDAVPMKVKKTLVDDSNPVAQIFDVQIDCAGGAPVSGYLAVPRDKSKKYPIRVGYDGAGVRSAYLTGHPADAILFHVNAHGLPNGKPEEFYRETGKTALAGYSHRGWETREGNYFRGMYQRLMRAHEFVKSLPEWDRRNLIVSGGSQGGAQAVVAAALDGDVTVMVSWVTALCDLTGSLHGRSSGWPCPDVKNPAVAANAAYYDVANFATRVNPDTACLMMVGFIDEVCAPISVYAAYHNLAAKNKTILHDISGGHRLLPGGGEAIGKFIQSNQKQ